MVAGIELSKLVAIAADFSEFLQSFGSGAERLPTDFVPRTVRRAGPRLSPPTGFNGPGFGPGGF
jgi:hypothetical protein